MKKILSSLLLISFLSGCAPADEPVTQDEKIKVIASFYPLGFFAEQIGGDLLEVTTIVPSGVEPHEYEPSPTQLKSIYDSDLFIYNGANFEPWVEEIGFDLHKEEVHTFQASDYVELLPGEGQEEEHEETSFIPKASAHETGEEHTEWDPHFWLDPVRAQNIVGGLAAELAQLDPKNASTYQANAKVIQEELGQIHEDFTNALSTCTLKEFVTSHAAFQYLEDRYSLTMIPIRGLSPQDEPTLKELEEIVQLVKEHQLPVIYTESLISSAYAETLSGETGASVLVLNPIEGLTAEQKAVGENYLTLMQQNSENLQAGLNCSANPL